MSKTKLIPLLALLCGIITWTIFGTTESGRKQIQSKLLSNTQTNQDIKENLKTYSLGGREFINNSETAVAPTDLPVLETSELVEQIALTTTVQSNKLENNNNEAKEELPSDARELFRPLLQKQVAEPEEVNNQANFAGVASGTNILKTPAEVPSPSEEPNTELPWAYGQARGYAMLYALKPEARKVVERQVENLRKSRIRDVYIAVLIDGTFGDDFNYLQQIMARLSDSERDLTLALYLTNGPTMRVWDQTPIRTAFSQYEPRDFRRRIMWDERVREKFREIIVQAKHLFAYNLSLNRNNKNIVFPMLEDNLDRDSYISMRDLTVTNIGGLAKFMRNPCLGCYSGNNADSLGAPIEEHHTNYFHNLQQQDAFTFDGIGFNYPSSLKKSVVVPEAVSAESTLELMSLSLEKGLSCVGLWRPNWQGIIKGTDPVHPDLRKYTPSTKAELEFELKLLRSGLSLEYADET